MNKKNKGRDKYQWVNFFLDLSREDQYKLIESLEVRIALNLPTFDNEGDKRMVEYYKKLLNGGM